MNYKFYHDLRNCNKTVSQSNQVTSFYLCGRAYETEIKPTFQNKNCTGFLLKFSLSKAKLNTLMGRSRSWKRGTFHQDDRRGDGMLKGGRYISKMSYQSFR